MSIEAETEEENGPDLSFAYFEADRLGFVSSRVIKFRDKTLDEWLDEIAIPEISLSMSMDDMEKSNILAINLIEKVNRNYSYAKSAFDLASLKYETGYQNEKVSILQAYQRENKKFPTSEMLATLAGNNTQDLYAAYKISELFYEFWKTAQQKIKSLDGRLTSISMIYNTERKESKFRN